MTDKTNTQVYSNPRIPTKLSPPRLGHYYPRERLLTLLDSVLDKQLIWLSAPAGYGKTMLAASYLASRELHTLWYRLDERDNDPGSFFYYLRQVAIYQLGEAAETLPILRPENLPGLTVFAQNFFEQLVALCRQTTVIVFDNLQELPPDSPIMTTLPIAAEALPETVHFMLISRNQPPACLARLHSHQQMVNLTAAELSLDQNEIRALAEHSLNVTPTEDILHTIIKRTEGWAAGVVLMLEQLRNSATLAETSHDLNETLFDYLATEVFTYATPELQSLLLKTACLPVIDNEIATALTNLAQAGQMLAELTRKNYFIYRQTAPNEVYHYHPLFRQFLLSRARQTFTPEQYRQHVSMAARLLAEKSDADYAAQLAIETGDWELLGRLILEHAESMLQRGRYLSLQQWLKTLPDEQRNTQPWFSFWYGNSLLPFDPQQARNYYTQAFTIFREQGDQAGLYLAWAGIIDTYFFLWDEFFSLDRWITLMEETLAAGEIFPGPEIAARVTFGMFCALMYRQPQHPAMQDWCAKVKQLVVSTMPLEHRLFMGNQLVLYLTWTGNLTEAGTIVGRLQADLHSDRNVQPSTLAAWHGMEATYYWFMADVAASLQAVQQALDIGKRSGVHLWDFFALAQGVYATLTAGQVTQARGYLQQMEEQLNQQGRLHAGHYHYLASFFALLNNTLAVAREHAEQSLASTSAMGVVFPQALSHLALAHVYRKQKHYARATEHLLQAQQLGRAMHSQMLEHQVQLLQALIAFEQADESAAVQVLRSAMQLGNKMDFQNSDWWQSDMMAYLCGKAMQYDIEPEHARHLIQTRGLSPAAPPIELENWPWPLKIHTLGRFTLLRNDEPLEQTGKGMNKLLALLKALIAFGGRGISEPQISEALWPDAEGDAAHNAYTTTLHRLRKFIGLEDIIQVKGQHIGFNPQRVWIDIWGLERLMGEIHDRLQGQAESDKAYLDLASQHLLASYTGAFLRSETEAWILPTRERLRSKFLRAVRLLGQAWASHLDWQQAITLYESALQIDPLAEDVYQALMHGYQQQGRIAEAIATYQRCRQQLQHGLQITPSAETESIYQQLQNM